MVPPFWHPSPVLSMGWVPERCSYLERAAKRLTPTQCWGRPAPPATGVMGALGRYILYVLSSSGQICLMFIFIKNTFVLLKFLPVV